MTPPVRALNQDALQAQLIALGERMDANFKRLEGKIDSFEERVRAVEQNEAGCQPITNARLNAVERRTDTNSADIETLKETVAELKHTNRILAWFSGLVGSTLIVWLIGQILGLVK